MEIISSIIVGTVAGGLAALICRPPHHGVPTSIAVGILGGLLGLAADFWLAAGGLSKLAFSEYFASGVGALIALTLWMTAQRLFFASPPESAIGEEL